MNLSLKLIAVILGFVVLVSTMIYWGVPNSNHPFTYHMDEWHQLMAVRGVFTQGSANIPGAAHGPLFQYFLSGIFLGPFFVLRIIDPFSITSSLGNLEAQKMLFVVLRLNSLMFGVLAIIVLWHISKKYLQTNPFVTIFFFTFTPIWIMLSTYFKYDIALIFWLLLTIYCLLWYNETKNKNIFFLSGFLTGITLATKISSVPLVLVYPIAYLLFTRKNAWMKKDLFIGFSIFTLTFSICGIPDLFFGTGDYYEFIYSNLVSIPNSTEVIIYNMPASLYLPVRIFPMLFGHAFYLGLIASAVIVGYFFLKRKTVFLQKKQRIILFLALTLGLFILSLIPLKVSASGNRSLVLLPFFALFFGIFIDNILQKIKGYKKTMFWGVIGCLMLVQMGEVLIWTTIKWLPDPRVISSVWIQKHISPSPIGIENIPIYQYLPDMVLKEFYVLQDNPKAKTRYTYVVVDEKSPDLPSTIIISNAVLASQFYTDLPKKRLLARLKKEGYREVKKFDLEANLYRYFGTERELFVSGLIPYAPISIFQKNSR